METCYFNRYFNRKPKKNDYGFENSNITHYIYAPKEDSYIIQKWRLKDKSLEVRGIPKNIAQVYTLSPGATLAHALTKLINVSSPPKAFLDVSGFCHHS